MYNHDVYIQFPQRASNASKVTVQIIFYATFPPAMEKALDVAPIF